MKVKFFKQAVEADATNENEEEPRTRVKFVKKRGDITQWYKLFNEIKDYSLGEVLLKPNQQEIEGN